MYDNDLRRILVSLIFLISGIASFLAFLISFFSYLES